MIISKCEFLDELRIFAPMWVSFETFETLGFQIFELESFTGGTSYFILRYFFQTNINYAKSLGGGPFGQAEVAMQ